MQKVYNSQVNLEKNYSQQLLEKEKEKRLNQDREYQELNKS